MGITEERLDLVCQLRGLRKVQEQGQDQEQTPRAADRSVRPTPLPGGCARKNLLGIDYGFGSALASVFAFAADSERT